MFIEILTGPTLITMVLPDTRCKQSNDEITSFIKYCDSKSKIQEFKKENKFNKKFETLQFDSKYIRLTEFHNNQNPQHSKYTLFPLSFIELKLPTLLSPLLCRLFAEKSPTLDELASLMRLFFRWGGSCWPEVRESRRLLSAKSEFCGKIPLPKKVVKICRENVQKICGYHLR